MEYLRGENPEIDKTPEDSGEFGESKKSKKRKKVTKIAKSSIWRPAAEKASEYGEDKSEKPLKSAEKSVESKPEKLLPDLEPAKDKEEGVLIIDHSDEVLEAEISSTTPEDISDKTTEEGLSESKDDARAGSSLGAELIISTDPELEARTAEEELPPPPRVAPPFPLFASGALPLSHPEVAHATGSPASTEASIGHPLHREGAEAMINPSFTQSTEAQETEHDIQRRLHLARKRGVSRGVVSGLVAGFWAGGRRGRRQTAEALGGQVKDSRKQLNELQADYKELESQYELSKRRLDTLEQASSSMSNNLDSLSKQVEFDHLAKPEAGTHINSAVPTEIIRPLYEVAKDKSADAKVLESAPRKPEKPIVNPEIAPEDKPVTEDMFATLPDRRVETSAWHRIEIDKATGKAIENPALAYGEAFVREKKQEKLARDAAKAQTAAQVGMTLLDSGTKASDSPLLPQNTADYRPVPPLKPKKPIRQIVKENLPYIRQQLVKRTASPATWAVSAGAVLVLILLGIL